MKIAFIIPRDHDTQNPLSDISLCRVIPPLGLARMVGFIGKKYQIKVLDERVNPIETSSFELAIIFINCYNQQRAYDLCKQFRELGTYVVLTGAFLAHIRQEARIFADSLLIGQGEACFPIFLSDYSKNKAMRVYNSETRHNVVASGNNVLRLEF